MVFGYRATGEDEGGKADLSSDNVAAVLCECAIRTRDISDLLNETVMENERNVIMVLRRWRRCIIEE